MANIKSQIKRNRQNETRHERNKAARSRLRTRIKNALAAAESGDAERAAELTSLAQREIDQAAAKGVLKANTASRRKSTLQRQVNDLLAG
jgi:small subunit ribosomal protein S20